MSKCPKAETVSSDGSSDSTPVLFVLFRGISVWVARGSFVRIRSGRNLHERNTT